MRTKPFYIDFDGPAERVPALARFLSQLAAEKAANADGSMIVEDCEPIIADGKWLDLLDPATLRRMTDGRHWGLEDILLCVLQGEYRLLGVEFADGRGRLLYEPLAAPF